MSALVLQGAYLDILDKPQKRVCRSVGHLLPSARRYVSPAHGFFIGITLVDFYLDWLNWFPSLFSRELHSLF